MPVITSFLAAGDDRATDYREQLQGNRRYQERIGSYCPAVRIRVVCACEINNTAAMESIRAQVNDILPEPSFGEDILDK